MADPVIGPRPNPLGTDNSEPILNPSDAVARRGDPVLSSGIAVMYLFLNLLTNMADQKFSQMARKSDIARDAQEMANKVDAGIANMSKPDDTAELPKDVIDYMRDNNIYMTDKNGKQVDIDKWIAESTKNKTPDKLDKGEMSAVKAALENVANRSSDFVSQSQLQIQKLMQAYNVAVSMINSMQTMLAEMNKAIAQGIR